MRFLVLSLVLWTLPAPADGQQPRSPSAGFDHVRTGDPRLRLALDLGSDKSSTMLALLEFLESLPVIVHVVAEPCRHRQSAACTYLAGSSPGMRYVHIQLGTWRPLPEVVSLVGHELQHAVEIGCDSRAVDALSVAALFGRIGEMRNQGRFETKAAKAIGVRIRDELDGRGRGARAIRPACGVDTEEFDVTGRRRVTAAQ